MSHPIRAVVSAASVATLLACGDQPMPIGPSPGTLTSERSGEVRRNVLMLDRCDPKTFNAAIGEGTCTRNGGVTFNEFVRTLARLKSHPAWRFSPTLLDVPLGRGFNSTNVGGEVHTFTEVAAFGGGIVPFLNELTGNTVVVPECKALAPTDFIPPGGSTPLDIPSAAADELYQCCIHPWMRMKVHIH